MIPDLTRQSTGRKYGYSYEYDEAELPNDLTQHGLSLTLQCPALPAMDAATLSSGWQKVQVAIGVKIRELLVRVLVVAALETRPLGTRSLRVLVLAPHWGQRE